MKTPTSSHKSASPVDVLSTLQSKLDCSFDEIQRSAQLAINLLSHSDTNGAIQQLTSIRQNVMKCRPLLHKNLAIIRQHVRRSKSTDRC